MRPEHFINDYDETVNRIEEILAKLRAQCHTEADTWTPEQEARWEGAFTAVRGILADELFVVQEAWRKGHPAWRSTEKMMEDTE
jgi:hypothetical protein